METRLLNRRCYEPDSLPANFSIKKIFHRNLKSFLDKISTHKAFNEINNNKIKKKLAISLNIFKKKIIHFRKVTDHCQDGFSLDFKIGYRCNFADFRKRFENIYNTNTFLKMPIDLDELSPKLSENIFIPYDY
ncbi:hypothetical protein BpHYR1_043736 [Brachionus plicatilis]|uniref:Uncharacterized protein n=1 Tax=Brachionus plicatilis TaxID=10195 RepID=A0A3M7PHZ5_BRAPC|nr:hypothetical protein BpHYR1_043736 [Brachionus plicatilis]